MREEEKLQVSEATCQTEKKAWEHDKFKGKDFVQP